MHMKGSAGGMIRINGLGTFVTGDTGEEEARGHNGSRGYGGSLRRLPYVAVLW